MKRWNIHIEQWLGSMLMLLLTLTACTSSDMSEEPEKPKEKPVLKVYIFAPERPIVTRADNGNVNATDEEKAIHTLDVWVFEHESPYDKVTYTHLDNLSFDGQKEVTMELSDDFANLVRRHMSNLNPRNYSHIFVAVVNLLSHSRHRIIYKINIAEIHMIRNTYCLISGNESTANMLGRR